MVATLVVARGRVVVVVTPMLPLLGARHLPLGGGRWLAAISLLGIAPAVPTAASLTSGEGGGLCVGSV